MASGGGELFRLLEVELQGILVHLWGIQTAEQLLVGYCLVHDLHLESEEGIDLSVFKLRAWSAVPGCVSTRGRTASPGAGRSLDPTHNGLSCLDMGVLLGEFEGGAPPATSTTATDRQ
jgi:hypothetical protein